MVGIVLVYDHNCVGADHFVERHTNGFKKVEVGLVAYILDQVDEHFGIGVRGKAVATVDELFLEGGVVLDDAVVDDGQ